VEEEAAGAAVAVEEEAAEEAVAVRTRSSTR
jgi:hypothetical protein